MKKKKGVVKKEPNEILYRIYLGLLIFPIVLLLTCLILSLVGAIETTIVFAVLKFSLIMLIVSIFVKSEL